MDNLVSLNNTKKNLFEFDLSIKGYEPKDMKTKFIIQANGMEIAFEAVNVSGNKWEVNIPELPILERTAYPFFINIDADGYNFKPLKGTVNVVGSNDVYVTTPKNPKISAPIVETKKEEIKKEEKEVKKEAKKEVAKTKPGEKPIAQIAEEMMAVNKAKPVKEAVVIVEGKPIIQHPVVAIPVVETSMLPTIKIEPKVSTKGKKDDAVNAILEETGLRPKGTKLAKPLSRFSLKN